MEVRRVTDPVAAGADGLLVSVGSDLEPLTALEGRLVRSGGLELRRPLDALGEMPPGAAVVTPGGDLAVEMVIHVVIRSREEPITERGLVQAVRRGLEQAARWEVERLALPLLGIGAGNLDAEVAAAILIRVYREHRLSHAYPSSLVFLAETTYQEEAVRRALGPTPMGLEGWLALPGGGGEEGGIVSLNQAPKGPWALATAGGKDATLALHRARAAGREVHWALNIFEGNSGLVRFHGTPKAVLRAQTAALGLDPVFDRTHPRDFDQVLTRLLEDLRGRGACGVIFGNLHLTEIRDWYAARVAAAGLAHLEPLWGVPPMEVARSVVEEGFRARVISVNLERGDAAWLGRELDEDLLSQFQEAGIDPCGEQGEYHTLVVDGPSFSSPVEVAWGEPLEREGHRFLTLGLPPGS